jgi:hypothetical protein
MPGLARDIIRKRRINGLGCTSKAQRQAQGAMTDAKRNAPDAKASSDDRKAQTGRGGAGEPGSGAYPDPHTGKELRGEKRGFIEGGQSENRNDGPKHAEGHAARNATRNGLVGGKVHEGM